MELTRRKVLAGLGATLVAERASAESGALAVTGTRDGGFVVSINFREVWRVSGAQTRAHWGPDATAKIETRGEVTAVVLKKARLLGETASLELAFVRDQKGWQCAMSFAAGKLSAKSAAPFPLSGPHLSAPTSGTALVRAAHLQPHIWANAKFELDRALRPRATGTFLFGGLGGFKSQGTLYLLPRTDDGTAYARMEFGPTDIISLTKECSVRPASMSTFFYGRNDNLTFKGAGTFQVGQVNFAGHSECKITFSKNLRGGGWRWSADWRLPEHEQLIETPHGRMGVVGTGLSDIQSSGQFGKLEYFNAAATLKHVAHRLPLGKSYPGYADLARLDFTAAGERIRLLYDAKQIASADLKSGSWVSLIPGSKTGFAIKLDQASLLVVREADMFHGKFTFRGLALKRGSDGLWLLTADPKEQLLKVELPSQHLMEKSFFRQLPVLPGAPLLPDELPLLFSVKGRGSIREQLEKRIADFSAFSIFAKRYEETYRSVGPKDEVKDLPLPPQHVRDVEAIYVGREGLFSLRSRRVATLVANAIRDESLPVLREVKLGLGAILVADILQRARGNLSVPWTLGEANTALQELLTEARKRSDDHNIIQTEYLARTNGTVLFYARDWLNDWPKEFPAAAPPPTIGRKNLNAELGEMLAVVIAAGGFPDPSPSEAALQAAYKEDKYPLLPVQALAAGPTRLVFDVANDRGEKPGEAREVSARPYSLETLLAWKNYDLKVTQRANRFGAGQHPGMAANVSEEAKLIDALMSQKINPSTVIKERFDQIIEQARLTPNPFETQIELPAKLFLSPARDVNILPSWPKRVSRVPIWQAELREKPGERFSLRAVGSPDFEADVFDPALRDSARARLEKPDAFLSPLNRYDRHQIVALSSIYGLPVIARQSPNEGSEQTSQIAPPTVYRLEKGSRGKEGLRENDEKEQAIYIPRPMRHRLLTLSPVGASLDLDATFVPPASVRNMSDKNLFDAFSIERWRSLIAFGRDVTTEVVYKGFLYPIGFRATLVKVTERVFEPWQGENTLPIGFLRQRLYIQISDPTKLFPAVGQPFGGNCWPASSMTLDMSKTPDIVDPTRAQTERPQEQKWSTQGSGRLDHPLRVGMVFWPRSAPGEAGNIQFRMKIDGRPELVAMPMIFVDNAAAHDPPTMRALRRHYNNDAEVGPHLKLLKHGGVRRRYANEQKPGDATLETLEWRVSADSLRATLDEALEHDPSDFLMNSAMESVDQPPVFPRLASAVVCHDTVARFSGNPPAPMEVKYFPGYIEKGFVKRADEEKQEKERKENPSGAAENIRPKPDANLAKQAFLVTTANEPPSLDMGANGDRSGGVGRPSNFIRAIGRDGPIGGSAKWDAIKGNDTAPTFGDGFFDENAKVLGIVRLNELVKVAVANTKLPPLLKDTLDFSCDVLKGGAKGALSAVEAVEVQLKQLPEEARKALTSLSERISDEKAALERVAKACAPNDVAAAVSATRNLIDEVDRLASAPLAILTSIVDGRLEKLKTNWLAEIERQIELPIRQLLLTVPIARLAELLLPIGAGLAALDRLEELAALRGPLTVLLEQSVTHAFKEPLPLDLQGLRDRWVDNVVQRLEAEKNNHSDAIKASLDKLKTAVEALKKRSAATDFIAQLYRAAVILRGDPSDWARALNVDVPTKALEDELAFWWSRTGLPDCAQLVDGSIALRKALVAQRFDKSVCADPRFCVANQAPGPNAPAALCTLLWQLCLDLPDPNVSKTARELAQAYAAFAEALSALAAIEAQYAACTVADLTAAQRDFSCGLQRLDAARTAFIDALQNWFNAVKGAALGSLNDAAATRLATALATALRVIKPEEADIKDFVKQLTPLLGQVTAAAFEKRLQAPLGEVETLIEALDRVKTVAELRKAIDAIEAAKQTLSSLKVLAEQAVMQSMLRATLPARQAAEDLLKRIIAVLASGYRDVLDARNKLRDDLDKLQADLSEDFKVTLPSGALRKIAEVDKDSSLVAICGTATPNGDGLDLEAVVIQCMRGLSGASQKDAALALLTAWSRRAPALMRLISDLGARITRTMALPAQLQILDLDDLRAQLNNLLGDIVPTRRTLEYDWTLPLPRGKEIPIGASGSVAKFILPSELKLSAKTTIDLLRPTAPVVTADGKLDSFKVNILSDSVILRFKPFTFNSANGGSRFSADIEGVDIGASLAFLTALAVYFQAQGGDASDGLGDKPNGPYVEQRKAGPGVQAGYRINIGAAQLGTLAIQGLNFDAHCELPFDSASGAVRISLATPEAPFLITCAPYGGRGHFFLVSGPDTAGVRFDVGFQWGGAAAISFGPLQGAAFIMVGFRMSNLGGFEFAGFFIAAFEGHVACFGVSGSFVVSLRSTSGQMRGEATLTFKFSCGPAEITYRVGVGHNAGSRMGDRAWLEQQPGEPQTMWAGLGQSPAAVATANVPGMLENWSAYRRRFDFKVRAAGRRKRR
ncbi:hypothetical protein MicloDRAFT_00045960 [Microvirga lotononidis]|uniref:Uncharacterized protein n=2 Tax=Microvirga lotononidis TaxID=864069 RepID=I4YVM7_9HYPH|nr:hypothetical protein MicloDRAFT_00045960 [Microvirga lotononidis]